MKKDILLQLVDGLGPGTVTHHDASAGTSTSKLNYSTRALQVALAGLQYRARAFSEPRRPLAFSNIQMKVSESLTYKF